VLPIEILYVTLAEVAHQSGTRPICRWGQKQMHMVCHQAVRMHRAIVLIGQLAQVCQVNEVITVTAEAGSAIVAALNDMDGYAGQDQA